MNSRTKTKENIHINKRFGLVTSDQVILINGSNQNDIFIDSINHVNLIKQRTLFTNRILMLFGTFIIGFSYFFLTQKPVIYTLIALGVAVLLYSLIHKFYIYKLIIEKDNQAIYKLETNQFHRKSIKSFYTSIAKKVKQSKRAKNN